MLQRTLVPSFFSLSSLFCIRPIYVKFHVIYQVKGISWYVWGVCKCEWVCFGMHRCVGVGLGMCGSVQVCAYTHGCAQVWVWWWVWDEFSEYLLETRVLTSADFDTYPIRIFYRIIVFSSLQPVRGIGNLF